MIIAKKKSANPTQKRKALFLIPMLALPVANFLIFWLYANFQSILNAFRIEEYGEIKYSFLNWKYLYEELFGNNSYAVLPELLRNTLLYFAVAVFVIMPLALFLSYFLYKRIRFYKFYRVIFFLPNIISGAVLATLYKFLFNPSVGGPLSMLFARLAGTDPVNLLMSDKWALPLVILYSVWTGFSVNLIIFNSAMSRIPLSVMEAAQIDGVNMRQEFFKIMVPLMWPTLSTIIVTNVAGMFTSSGAVLLLTGGDYHTSSIAFWIWTTTRNELSIYYPSTVALCCTAVSFPLVIFIKWLTGKIYPDVEY